MHETFAGMGVGRPRGPRPAAVEVHVGITKESLQVGGQRLGESVGVEGEGLAARWCLLGEHHQDVVLVGVPPQCLDARHVDDDVEAVAVQAHHGAGDGSTGAVRVERA
ncbi:hypothetical protein AB0H63_04975 [Micromonospora echinospora]|uniref:hypothetical protein n=1 Tax=Micromonospora echinospora TaxID=1877 RepID=UPI0033D9D6D5